jgi:Pvc16 N-terminal domain
VRHAPAVPLDLHYLLAAWAKDADTQQRLVGWSVRVLQDAPTLRAGVLNSHVPEPVFRPEETVEIVWESLSQRDLFDIWDVARANQQPSAAYVARIVEIDSTIGQRSTRWCRRPTFAIRWWADDRDRRLRRARPRHQCRPVRGPVLGPGDLGPGRAWAGRHDTVAELEQLALDPRVSPARVLRRHPYDQRRDDVVDRRAAGSVRIGLPVAHEMAVQRRIVPGMTRR